jgi:DNA processing protein
LKDGAKVVESADDILEELGWRAAGAPRRPPDRPADEDPGKISGKSLKTQELLDKLLPGQAYDVDELSATVGLTGSDLLSRLTEWEMGGQVVKAAGGRYVLAGRLRRG